MVIESDRSFSKPKILLGILTLLLMIAGLAPRSSAQDQPPKRFDLFGGYSFLRLDSTSFAFNNNANMNGFNGSVAFNVNETWALALDGSGNYGDQITAYNFMLGPQYSYRQKRSRIFLHLLGGKAQNTVNINTIARTGFESVGHAIAVGGGFDFDLTSRLSLRAVQADYLNTGTFNHSQNDVRISTGVVFHLGSRKRLF